MHVVSIWVNSMIILSDSFFFVPAIVDANRLEAYWKKDDGYLARWSGPPCRNWFLSDEAGARIGFFAGLVNLDGEAIGFTNGRHRTRWLLGLGLKSIPVCIEPGEIDAWHDIDIIEITKQPIFMKLDLSES